MKRSVFASAAIVLFGIAVSAPPASAQAKITPPPPAAAAPATAGKWVPPVKGSATINVMRGTMKIVGKEWVTPVTIKNTSTGSINLLKVVEDWYDNSRAVVSSGVAMYRKPFLPGEIITLEIRSPVRGKPYTSQLQFSHANGSIVPNAVKKVE